MSSIPCNTRFFLNSFCAIITHLKFPVAGSYIYIEASCPRVKGDKAIIDVGPFKADQNYCFTFYYNMYGKHIGRLSVYQSWLNSSNLQLLWSHNNTNFFFWKSSSFDIRSEKQFYVSIISNFFNNQQSSLPETKAGVSPAALNRNCPEFRVAKLLHFWSQTFNNAHCFSLYLPFVFIVFLTTLMTIWLQKCSDLATLPEFPLGTSNFDKVCPNNKASL